MLCGVVDTSISDDWFVVSCLHVFFQRFATACLLAVFNRLCVSGLRPLSFNPCMLLIHFADLPDGVCDDFQILHTHICSISMQLFYSVQVAMPSYFLAYCPCAEGTPCRKGTQKLGSFYNERDARQGIYNHLVNSSHHELGDAAATEAADKAQLAEMEYSDDEDDASKPKAKSTACNKGSKVPEPERKPQTPIGGSSSASNARCRDRSRSRDFSAVPPPAAPPPPPPPPASDASIRRVTAARLTEIVRSSVGDAIREMAMVMPDNTAMPAMPVTGGSEPTFMMTGAQLNVQSLIHDPQACWNLAVGALRKFNPLLPQQRHLQGKQQMHSMTRLGSLASRLTFCKGQATCLEDEPFT